MSSLDNLLIARILSDDLIGDISGRRCEIARNIASLAVSEEPTCRISHLWILNRVRSRSLLQQYKMALECHSPVATLLGGETAVLHSSRLRNTKVLLIPFNQEDLDSCQDSRSALLYLANPNVARNAALSFGKEAGSRCTFVLDGDIYIPRPVFDQLAELFAKHGEGHPVWLFTIRAWSIGQFESDLSGRSATPRIVDTCENEFLLNSWPPKVIRLGDEGMLGLPPDAESFDEQRTYNDDSKVAYCTGLRKANRTILTPSYPVCHLEHRSQESLSAGMGSQQQEAELLEHRQRVRELAKTEMLRHWRGTPPGECGKSVKA